MGAQLQVLALGLDRSHAEQSSNEVECKEPLSWLPPEYSYVYLLIREHYDKLRPVPRHSIIIGNYCDIETTVIILSPCCTTIHYWIVGVYSSTCSLVRSTKLCRVPSVRLENQEWHWWQYSTPMQQGRVCMATDRFSRYTCICKFYKYSAVSSHILVHTWIYAQEPCGKWVHIHTPRALAVRWQYISV